MDNIVDIVDEARKKLEQEEIAAGTPQEKVKEICLLWLSASDDPALAAKLVLTDGKTVGGAYRAMEDKARTKKQGKNCVYMPPEEAIGTIMEYFGMDGDKAQQELEHGLIYKIMMAESQKYKPYGMTEKPQPDSETKIDLSAFTMEGLL